MLYCINPKCPQRQITDTVIECPRCHTNLVINNRYLLIRPLRDLDKGHPYAEIFEVEDLKDNRSLKVLKILRTDRTQLIELFEQEANLLTNLFHLGIPKGEEKFSLGIDDDTKLHCLVMEKVEGQNLEQWLKHNGKISEQVAIDWLEQIVTILDYIHQNKLFHRDIKPSNIMRKPNGKLILIDFGTARKITQTVVNGHEVTVVYSDGYTPTEQIDGRAIPQSDFFALGRTFVHLLTGKHPNDFSRDKIGNVIWRNHAPQISATLADLISQLMAYPCEKRPKNTKILLRRIKEIKQPDYPRIFLKLMVFGAIVLLGGAGSYGTYWYFNGLGGCSRVWLRYFPLSDSISCGEELLVPGYKIPEEKQGVAAFYAGDYDKAVDMLQKAWQQQRDPEILIYLNNARLMRQKAYTIAVVAPITNNQDTALEMLRGVALAQNEINQGQKIHGVGLKVLIADDKNEAVQSERIAQALVDKHDVLGVVGHFASDMTFFVMNVYQQHHLAMISPTSTSEYLSIFRTVPSDRMTSEAMANYLINQVHQQKVAIFYNSQSNYSSSLQEQFHNRFVQRGGKIVQELDLSNPLFNASADFNQARKKGATALVLLPDSQTTRNALKVLKANQGRDWIVAGDGLYNSEILQLGGQDAVNHFVVAIPWHSLSSPNREFPKAAQKLWGGEVSWRTALTYDATRVLISALEKQPQMSRIDVQQALKDPKFVATGATGTIHFQPNGNRREARIQLVKVVPSQNSDYSYVFVPVN